MELLFLVGEIDKKMNMYVLWRVIEQSKSTEHHNRVLLWLAWSGNVSMIVFISAYFLIWWSPSFLSYYECKN